MTLPQYLHGVGSYRNHLLHLKMLEEDWNTPSRSDYYQMQTACEVRRVLSKNPRKIEIKHFVLKFGSGSGSMSKMTREQATALSQAKWLGLLKSKKIKVVKRNPNDDHGTSADDGPPGR